MAKNPFYESFYLNPDEDEDIREFLKQCKAMGYSKSYIIKKAIRHFMGKFNELQQENIDSANLRYIQFEKRLAELEKRDEERYQEILELIQKKFEESRKEREELRKELELIKKAQERLRAKAEEEKRKKEEEERGDYIQLIEEVYEDILREGVETWIVNHIAGERAIRTRYEKVIPNRAKELGIKLDYSKLRKILIENYPELAKHLFGKEAVLVIRNEHA